MNYLMPCLIKALTRSRTLNKITGEENKQHNDQKQKKRQKFNI